MSNAATKELQNLAQWVNDRPKVRNIGFELRHFGPSSTVVATGRRSHFTDWSPALFFSDKVYSGRFGGPSDPAATATTSVLIFFRSAPSGELSDQSLILSNRPGGTAEDNVKWDFDGTYFIPDGYDPAGEKPLEFVLILTKIEAKAFIKLPLDLFPLADTTAASAPGLTSAVG